MSPLLRPRAGISLLEVLISVGILAVGLTSVLALIPAGRSMATSSYVMDQASIVAANAVADLATQGYLRIESLSNANSPVLIDPLGAASWPPPLAPAVNQAVLQQNGVFEVASTPSAARNTLFSSYLMQSQDDIVFNVPETDAVDVTNQFDEPIPPPPPPAVPNQYWVRSYRGNFSWMALIAKASGPQMSAGDEVSLTVVVFHNRDVSQQWPSLGPYGPPNLPKTVTWTAGPLIPDRVNKELIRTNAICLVGLSPPEFRRITMAAIDDGDDGAFIEFEGKDNVSGQTVYAVPDAVAVFQKKIRLEAATPYQE